MTLNLYTALKARWAHPRRAPQPARRLLLEALEDRLVPSLADGTLLIATSPSGFSTDDPSAFPSGIITVDPATGAQVPLSIGGLFSLPTYLVEAPSGQLYVSDLTAFGTGAVFQVDPATGQQFLIAHGGYLNGPNALTYVNGSLYVANTGDGSGTVHSLVQIDPRTGQQRLITSDGGFTVPTGIAPAPDNQVYIADEPGGFAGSDPGGVWKVDLQTGQQTQVTHGGYIVHPSDLAVDAQGNLLTMGATSFTDPVGSIVRVDPTTGAQTPVSQDGVLDYLDGMGVDVNTGTIYAGAISTGAIPAALYAIDPVTGDQSLLASDGLLSLVESVRVYHPVVQTASTTTLNTSLPTAVFGQTVTFTATVRAGDTSDRTPTGTVQFQVDGSSVGSLVPVVLSEGVASAYLSTTLLSAGTHFITARYSGDSAFAGSMNSFLETVNKADTTTTLSASMSSSAFGQTVFFTATLSVLGPGSGTPTGTVQFQVDGSDAGAPVPVTTSAGITTASFSTSALLPGTPHLLARYLGDANFNASASSLLPQTVNRASTSTLLMSLANVSVLGQPITFLATVLPTGTSTPTGLVTFSDSGLLLGQATLSTSGGVSMASFTTANFLVGSHTVTASYAGDNNFQGSSQSWMQTVGKANTSTALVISTSTVSGGQALTFTATITVSAPGSTAVANPTGVVTFSDDATSLGQATLSSAGGITLASFTTTSLVAGSHTITASYAGDGNFLGSVGTLAQTVDKVGTSTLITTASNPVVTGQAMTFTATVTAAGPGSSSPTGTVQFQIDGSNVGNPVPIHTASGVTIASFSSGALPAGNHSVTASYSGDDMFVGSSALLSGGQTVNRASTTLTVTTSATSVEVGQPVTFTGKVAIVAPGNGTLSGTIQFQVDGSNVGSPVPIVFTDGTFLASFSTTALTAGTHSVSASYSGDSNFTGSGNTLNGSQVVTNPIRSDVAVSLNPNTGLLSITGDSGDDAITVNLVSPGVLQVAGTATLVNGSSTPATFNLAAVVDLHASLLNGKNRITMSGFTLAGNLAISAGAGADSISVDTITAASIILQAAGPDPATLNLTGSTTGFATIFAGDHALVALSGVNSRGTVGLTVGKSATLHLASITSKSDLQITAGDDLQALTLTDSSAVNLTVNQTGKTGNGQFDLENDRFSGNLACIVGDGNDTFVFSHLQVGMQLLVILGAGHNSLTADHVTAAFGLIDGGTSGSNHYVDNGGNSSYVITDFLGH